MESAYTAVVKNRMGFNMTMNAIKVESLDFTACLEALIVRSLNGTLSEADYDEDTWDKSIMMNMDTQCPEGLTSYQYSEDADGA